MTTSIRTVKQHRDVILAATTPTRHTTACTAEAEGLTLAADAHATLGVPAFTNSAMDGFAVRFVDVESASADAPVTLTVTADLPAGAQANPPLEARRAIRIMTGGPMPTAADTIVPFEDTTGGLADSLETTQVVAAPHKLGAFVRHASEDVSVGEMVLPAGTLLGPRQIASLQATGVTEVLTAAQPRLAIFSTGSELVAPGTPLQHGQTPDTNGDLLAGLARAAGADVVSVERVSDDPTLLREALDQVLALGLDAICFSGGVSAGAFEVVRNTLEDSEEMAFTKVAMQPGKPQGFSVHSSGCLLFGLPGNPVSSAVSFETFVRPALLAMQGRTSLSRPRLRLHASQGWDSPAGREQHVPVVIDRSDPAAWTVAPPTAAHSASHLIGTLGLADALAIIPAEVTRVKAHDLVDVVPLP